MGAVQAIKIYKLLQNGHRVTIRRAAAETGLSRRSVYRYVKNMGKVIPLRVKDGVIVLDQQVS